MTEPGILHLVAPPSLTSWFEHFVDLGSDDTVLYVGDEPAVDPGTVFAILDSRHAPMEVVIHSSHETLIRDLDLAECLRILGHRVHSQSASGVALGADKVLMKEVLRRAGFPTPRWTLTAGAGSWCGPGVVKARRGTQSVGTRLLVPESPPATGMEFCEQYHAGVEYSVVVYRDHVRTVTFPVVWKGRTSLSLVPPWRRLRLCPYVEIDPRLDAELRDMSASIAHRAGIQGYVEIEYLHTDRGAVTVLELNPRVSGTMRLVAMATGLPIFSLYQRPEVNGHLPARRFAAETPYNGPSFALPAEHVFATSRLTVSTADPAHLPDKLARYAVGGMAVATRAVPEQ